MIESYVNSDGTYTPGTVWLYDARASEIRISWLPGFDDRGTNDQAKVADALNSGFHVQDIWSYYASPDSYNGFITLRTTPEALIAPDMQTAVEAMLQRIAAQH